MHDARVTGLELDCGDFSARGFLQVDNPVMKDVWTVRRHGDVVRGFQDEIGFAKPPAGGESGGGGGVAWVPFRAPALAQVAIV